MKRHWENFTRLFDQVFFRMSFQFIFIVLIAFIVLLVVGYYEARGKDVPIPTQASQQVP